ncbi:MAG: hypothetical protein ACK5WS_04245 [Alphaproteobacteria bacterium]
MNQEIFTHLEMQQESYLELTVEICQKIWRIVLEQAILDATRKSRNPRSIIYRNDGRQWLVTPSSDRDLVCYYAGIDPEKLSNPEFLELMNNRSRKILPRKYFKYLSASWF